MESELQIYTLFIDLRNLFGYRSVLKTLRNKELKQKIEFEKQLCMLLINSFNGKAKEYFKKRFNLDLIDKTDTHSKMKKQSKLSSDDKNADVEKLNLYSVKKRGIKFVK